MDDDLTALAAIQAGDTLTCRGCGSPVGTYTEVNGRLWLCIGAVTLTYAHGRCSKCLRLWHFDEGDNRLARLVARPGKEV